MGVKPRMVRHQLLLTLSFSSAVSLLLSINRILATHQFAYWFLIWNLFLAWLPLLFVWWLIGRLRTTLWLSAGNIILTLLWLGFLPNAFYIASDIIHIKQTGSISMLYDVTLFLSYTFNGFLLGYLSLLAVHLQLRKRISHRTAGWVVAGVLLLCSFAIYLGRYLRWNSWDILVNPAGLIFDVSEPFINPSSHPQVFTTTLMCFVLLGSIYMVSYQLVRLARSNRD